MASVTKVPLGAPTFGRKWIVAVNANTYESPSWIPLSGILECTPFKLTPTVIDQSDYDGAGYSSDAVAGFGWGIDVKVERKVTTASATAYNPAQEQLRAASLLAGIANRVDIQFYEVTASGPTTEAYRGYVRPVWNPDGGDDKSKVTATINLIGQGAYTAITHPDAAGVVPTVTSVSPATGSTAGGEQVIIYGTGFFKAGVDDVVAATGVKFGGSGGDAATDWVTLSDNMIAAITPAHAAGTVAVVVYNSEGISTVTSNFVYS